MGSPAFAEERRAERDEVHYRARGSAPDGRTLNLLIVNISPHGLMARCETELEAGQRIQIILPVTGAVTAEVRWALGGRLGCQFEKMIDLATYYDMLAAVVRGK